jgi:Right handed beta helix region
MVLSRTSCRLSLAICLAAVACGTDNTSPGSGAGGSAGSGGSSGSAGSGGSSGGATGGSSGGTSDAGSGGTSDAGGAAGSGGSVDSGTSPSGDVFVSPTGDDSHSGKSASDAVQTLQKAQELVRGMNSDMTRDLTVVLADGYYRLTKPLTLDPSDSGTNGHNVIWTAAAGARPVVIGSAQITGWSQVANAGASSIWSAQGPKGIRTRQLYIDGHRATRATGPVPSAATLATWKDPSGNFPPSVEFVYKGGSGGWTEPRCPVASATSTTITMAQPCWDNSNLRGSDRVGPGKISAPTSAENAYQLLDAPGEWYLDTGSDRFYYIPKPGENLANLDVEAPVLEALVTGGGTASKPLHDVVFDGIQFSYATWMGASSAKGFSEVQANYLNQGTTPTAGNALFDWYQTPANVSLTYDQNIQFINDVFVHLGAASLGLGNGSRNILIKGNIVTDTSGSGIQIGNVDKPQATGADQTVSVTIQDNHVFDTPVEFHGGIGIDVGYAIGLLIDHNQIDHLPYSGISVGWGGWPDKGGKPGIANFSHNNVVSNNLIFNFVTYLRDGAAIYSNGQTGSSFETGEHITGNVMHDQLSSFHVVNTDNGTDWMTVTGNAIWNTGPANSWGYCHPDYYDGQNGSTLVHENVTGNYWDNRSGNGSHGQLPTSSGTCNVQGNTDITSESEVPANILQNAGLEAAFKGLLGWKDVAPPPVP